MGYEKIKRELLAARGINDQDIVESTAASTALQAHGNISLETTSTTASTPVVYTLVAPVRGAYLNIGVASLASSSQGPFHVNAGSGVVFGTTDDMVALSTNGAGVTMFAVSSSQWIVTGTRGGTFSTST